jgi:hypothetical protein
MTIQSLSVPPVQAVLQVLMGYWAARSVYIAAKLGVADHVREKPSGIRTERRYVRSMP